MHRTIPASRSAISWARSGWRSPSSSKRGQPGEELRAPPPLVSCLRVLHARQARESGGQPPVVAVEDRHQRRHEAGANDGRVDEHGERESDAELLQPGDLAGDEAGEGGDHDHGRSGDDPPRPLEPVRDGARVVVDVVPRLAHARDEEDLVVHREAEEHREQEDRDPALDLRHAVEAEHVGADAPAEDDDEQAVDGGDREQVEQHRLEREHERAEGAQEHEIREHERAEHEPGQQAVRA